MVACNIIEEHNEAFYCWVNSFKNGAIRGNNTLLHFDDHSDLRSPVLTKSINGLRNADSRELKQFTYEQLTIDTFIVPTLFMGIIDNFLWIKHDMPFEGVNKMQVRSYNGEGKKMILEKNNSDISNIDDVKVFDYHKIEASNINNQQISTSEGIILDIDLDYFSCCENPFIENEIIIEISKDEYENFLENRKYHYLNFITANVDVKIFNGSYFYVLNHVPEIYPSKRKVSEECIETRLFSLVTFLKERNITPELITICRSRISGFTPKDQWEFIENRLMEELKKLYQIDLVYCN